ncbi:EPIDERMAL PATTERNING FACTOR-like protein 6 [Lactuca sativa]|uniref:EPIDERMAL PATTERNING FACTOR-like protein 6 n=1 Tax=Lactuca sativa TaxID=4236 RepID=UPI001C68B7CC|nr:EPIDERMAL PATTERNING FACTOR-like protein 6 [Lactuca sativa]
MDKRILLFLIIVWHMMMMMMSGVCARNIRFPPSHDTLKQGEILPSPQPPFLMRQGIGSIGNMVKEEEGLSRLGSRPPRCEHKCRGCTPCFPIQVPTAQVGPQYANYEPEGWKCKCGSIFFNP